jgi:hypothetical protein
MSTPPRLGVRIQVKKDVFGGLKNSVAFDQDPTLNAQRLALTSRYGSWDPKETERECDSLRMGFGGQCERIGPPRNSWARKNLNGEYGFNERLNNRMTTCTQMDGWMDLLYYPYTDDIDGTNTG